MCRVVVKYSSDSQKKKQKKGVVISLSLHNKYCILYCSLFFNCFGEFLLGVIKGQSCSSSTLGFVLNC